MRHDYVMHVVPVALSIIRNTWHKSLVAWHKSPSLGIKALSLDIKAHRRQCNVCDSTIKQHNTKTSSSLIKIGIKPTSPLFIQIKINISSHRISASIH